MASRVVLSPMTVAEEAQNLEVELRHGVLDAPVEIERQLQSPFCRLPYEVFEMIVKEMNLSSLDSLRHTCKRNWLLLTNGREIERQFELCCKRYSTDDLLQQVKLRRLGFRLEFDSSQQLYMRRQVVLEHCLLRRSTFRVPADRYFYNISEIRKACNYCTVVFSRCGKFVVIYDAREVDNGGNTSGWTTWLGRPRSNPNVYFYSIAASGGLVFIDLIAVPETVLGAEIQEVEKGYRVMLQSETTRTLAEFKELSGSSYELCKVSSFEAEPGLYKELTSPANIPFYHNLVQGRIAQRPRTKSKILKQWSSIRTVVSDACLPKSLVIQYDLPDPLAPQYPNLYIADASDSHKPLVNLHFDIPGKITHFAFAGSVRIAEETPKHHCKDKNDDCLSCWDDLPVYSEMLLARSHHRTTDSSVKQEPPYIHTRFAVGLNSEHVYLFDVPQSVMVSATSTGASNFRPRKIAHVPDLQNLVFTSEDVSRLCMASAKELQICDVGFSKALTGFKSISAPPPFKTFTGSILSDGSVSVFSEKPTWRESLQDAWKDRIEGFGSQVHTPKETSFFKRLFSL